MTFFFTESGLVKGELEWWMSCECDGSRSCYKLWRLFERTLSSVRGIRWKKLEAQLVIVHKSLCC